MTLEQDGLGRAAEQTKIPDARPGTVGGFRRVRWLAGLVALFVIAAGAGAVLLITSSNSPQTATISYMIGCACPTTFTGDVAGQTLSGTVSTPAGAGQSEEHGLLSQFDGTVSGKHFSLTIAIDTAKLPTPSPADGYSELPLLITGSYGTLPVIGWATIDLRHGGISPTDEPVHLTYHANVGSTTIDGQAESSPARSGHVTFQASFRTTNPEQSGGFAP
jgi:hypothetical protein